MAKKVDIQEIEPIEPADFEPIVEKPTQAVYRQHWNIGRIFWGLFLVLIGLLALASNYGLLSVNWFNLWRLWPLFIVLIGLSILTVRGWAGRLLGVVFVLLALCAVVYAVLSPQASRPIADYNQTSSRLSAASLGNINIKTGLGKLDINTSAQDAVAQAHLESSIANLTTDTTLNGSTQTTNITTNAVSDWSSMSVDNSLSVDVTRDLPLAINLDTGASEVSADLSLAQLQSLDIRSGATKSDIKLGDKEDLTTVNLNSGASSFIIRVPSSSGASVKLDGVTSSNIDGLVKNGDRYESTNYATAPKKIDIVGHLGLASFTLERY